MAAAILQWLLDDGLHTPVGDFEEYYHEVASQRGHARARWWYWQQVFREVPRRLIAKFVWNIVMFKSHLLLAFRNLRKNKASTLINIFGLSVAIGCTLVAFVFFQDKVNKELMHVNGDNVFLVQQQVTIDGAPAAVGYTPTPLGPAMAADLAQVVRTVRVDAGEAYVVRGEDEFFERIRFVDPGFFDMFTFSLKSGDAGRVLAQPGTAILNHVVATKYFGSEDPVGETITLRFGDELRSFTVGGVANPFPESTSLRFRILLPYDQNPLKGEDGFSDWSNMTTATFVQVANPRAVESLEAGMDVYLGRESIAREELERVPVGYSFENLNDMARNADDVYNTIAGTIPWAPIIVLTMVSVFLLVLSCANYVNIAMANATRRLNEIGIRKVVGSNRGQLVVQFLTENLALCLLSMVLGVTIAHFFLVPAFQTISGMENNLLTTPIAPLLTFLATLLLGVGFLSGAYPAIYISSFQPIAIMKNRLNLGRGSLFTQSMLGVQFTLAFITMIVCLGVLFNTRYERARDWGYDKEHTLVLRLPSTQFYEVMRNEVEQLPHVLAISGSRDHFGNAYQFMDVSADNEAFGAALFDVEPSYLKTHGVRLKRGSLFETNDAGASKRSIVVNETFVEGRGWDEPVGKSVVIDSTNYYVAGVAEDFHYSNFSDVIRPTILRVGERPSFRFISMRLEAGFGASTAEAVEQLGRRLMPNETNWYFFQDSVFDTDFNESKGIADIFLFVASLALLISCLGLFGLASQHTLSRMKEVSVRKVLGASVIGLAALLNRKYAILLVVAALIATPLSYVLLNLLLDSIYAYRESVGAGPFVVAYVLVFCTGILTISSQYRVLEYANPAELLRND